MALLSDKYGRKKIVAIGMVVYISGTFLCAIAQDIFQLLIFRAIQGAGAYSSVLQAMIGDRYDKSEQGKAMAYYSFSLSAGYFGGIVIGGYISYYLGFRSIFLIAGTLATISAFFFFLLSKESKTESIKNADIKAFEFKGMKLLLKEKQYTLSVLLNCIRWLCLNGVLVYVIWIFEI